MGVLQRASLSISAWGMPVEAPRAPPKQDDYGRLDFVDGTPAISCIGLRMPHRRRARHAAEARQYVGRRRQSHHSHRNRPASARSIAGSRLINYCRVLARESRHLYA